jgi:solute:Na+ symporter, SSS family
MEIYEKLRNPVALTIFIFTLFLPVLVGFWSLRRTKNQSDFFVGGRGMNKFVVALSAVSSGRSSWLVLALSGLAYLKGVAAVWAVIGYIIAEMFQFVYIGKKLRTQTELYDSITLLDYFESRFKDKYLLRITGSVIMIIFLTSYVAAQFSAGARSLSTSLGLSLFEALLIATALVLVYMVLGGFIAVAYNDVIRAVIMLFGLVVFPVYGLIKVGGFTVLLETLKSLDPAFIDPFSLLVGVVAGYIGIGLGSPGQPHIVVRYMSIDDPEKLRFAMVVGTVWNVIMGWGAVFVGLLGRIAIPMLSSLPDVPKKHEMIYLVLSSEYFGPIIYGILIGGIFAAILSTADSQLLVVASTFVRDIYEKIIYEKIQKKESKIPESRKLLLSRIVVLTCGILALILAYLAKDAIFWLVLYAWGGLGASFGTTLIFSLYWKRTTKYGIFAGMLSGTFITIIWYLFFKASTGIYELIPAFFGSALLIVLVSLLTPRRD